MLLATSFADLLQVFAVAMTQPTVSTLHPLIAGWVFAPRRTVLGMLRAAAIDRHHAAFHRLFATAAWSLDTVGLAVFDLILRFAPQATVFLAGDDSLFARRGRKVFGAGMHRDPMLSSRSHTVTRWGVCWVVLMVVLPSPRTPGRYFALPILARLYLDKKAAAKWRRAPRSKSDLMIDLLQLVHRHAPGQKLHFLGDSSYTAPAVLARIPAAIAVTGRVVLNVRLHAPAPARKKGQKGRPRVRGERRENPAEMLQRKGLPRVSLKLYQNSRYYVRLAEASGCFYKAPQRPVKVVAVDHLRGGRGQEAFYSTEISAEAVQILTWFSWRWSAEVTFHDAKQHLGVSEAQSRARTAVERTAPTGLLLYSLVVLWHEFVRSEPAPALRPWRGKRGASFAEMLAALRLDSLAETRETHFGAPDLPPAAAKIIASLERCIALAA